jgi:uncharacterized protein (DUF427 family)
MAKAVWNEETLAESATYKEVKGNVYLPPESVKWDFSQDDNKQYTCPWKGKAKYYDLVVKGQVNKNAAWNYPQPKPAAEFTKGYAAFGDGVKVEV